MAPIAGKWRSLFDGVSLDGWRSYGREEPAAAWSVEDGRIVLESPNSNNPAASRRGDLMTRAQYTNFELELEWKVSKGGNSGVMFGVREVNGAPFAHSSGVEIQILDNVNNRLGQTPNKRASAVYDILPPPVDSTKPVGEFNQLRLRVVNGKVTHSLNGVEMASFDVHSQKWRDLVAVSKFKNWEHFAKYETGHIVLQDHKDQVEFRNIRIRELKSEFELYRDKKGL